MRDRPTKRIKPNENPFLDLEAFADNSENEQEEEEEEAEEDEVDEDEEIFDSVARHAQLHQSYADTDYSDYWDHFLNDVIARSRSTKRKIGVLCEIGCKIGCEEVAVQKLSQIASHPIIGEELARPVFINPSWPGRVYAEVASLEEARQFVGLIEELKKNTIRLVPRELAQSLRIKKSPIDRQTWARVRGRKKPWSNYRGDVGLVERIGDKNVVLLVPRIRFAASKNAPPQILAVRSALISVFGADAVMEGVHGSYGLKGWKFSEKGFLMVDVDDIELIRGETWPTNLEYQLFQSSGLLEPELSRMTENAILQSRIKVGDRVKVIGGDFRGLVGSVMKIRDYEYVVDLPSQSLEEAIIRRHVRAAFHIGDEVKVIDGPSAGLTGWVIALVRGGLKVLNLEQEIEVDFATTQVEFYTSDFIATTLRPRNHKAGCRLGGRDPNDIYIGKRVMIVGASSWKGYVGRIKQTNPAGIAWVELDARQQQVQSFNINELAVLREDDSSITTVKAFGPNLSQNLTAQPPTPLPPRFATPIPSTSTSAELSPAWDPSSRTPLPLVQVLSSSPRESYWFEDEELQGVRIRLRNREDGAEGRILEFVSVEVDGVRVRDGYDTRCLALDSVLPVRPTAVDQLVTPLTGAMKGKIMKVKTYSDGSCTARIPGTRVQKHQSDPTFNTSDLVQVFPSVSRGLYRVR